MDYSLVLPWILNYRASLSIFKFATSLVQIIKRTTSSYIIPYRCTWQLRNQLFLCPLIHTQESLQNTCKVHHVCLILWTRVEWPLDPLQPAVSTSQTLDCRMQVCLAPPGRQYSCLPGSPSGRDFPLWDFRSLRPDAPLCWYQMTPYHIWRGRAWPTQKPKRRTKPIAVITVFGLQLHTDVANGSQNPCLLWPF